MNLNLYEVHVVYTQLVTWSYGRLYYLVFDRDLVGNDILHYPYSSETKNYIFGLV